MSAMASAPGGQAARLLRPERRPSALTHLAAVRRYDSEVSRDPVPAFHFHQIPDDDVLRIYAHFLTVSNHQGLLWKGESSCH